MPAFKYTQKIKNNCLVGTLYNKKNTHMIAIEFEKSSVFFNRSISEIINILNSISDIVNKNQKKDFDFFCSIVKDTSCKLNKKQFGADVIVFDFNNADSCLFWFDIFVSMFTSFSSYNDELNDELINS
jgi:hypothetical protein